MLVSGAGSLTPAAAASGDNSLRFNDDDSAYLSRTPSSAGNRKTWTFSCWVKRSEIDRKQILLDSDSGNELIYIHSPNELRLVDSLKTSNTINIATSQLFRDTSAWYHIIIAMDTTQATASDRTKIYVNGEQVTAFSASDYPTLNKEFRWNGTYLHHLGSDGGNYFDGYLAEVHFIDGTALTPSSFGEEDTDYKHWKPIEVTGLTYGTNGFYLDFKDSADLGNDANGSNNWTSNNLASTDQMLDSPTNNFCTLNPIDNTESGAVLSEGNVKLTVSHGGLQTGAMTGSMVINTGKYYFEVAETVGGADQHQAVGISETGMIGNNFLTNHNAPNMDATAIGYGTANGYLVTNSTRTTGYPSSTASSRIVCVAVDMDNSKIWFRINDGSWYGSSSSSSGDPTTGSNGQTITAKQAIPVVYAYGYNGGSNPVSIANFGQDSSFAGAKTAQGNQDSNSVGDFYYTPPTDFLALCTSNLTAPAVKPQENFNTVLYTGDSATSHSITGVGFQPDFLWLKKRSAAESHGVFDSVRGANKRLHSELNNAETTVSAMSSFDSDGFTVETGAGVSNESGYTYVAWNWKAGNATLGTGDFTQGTIASTCSRNVDAGFSIVSYTGTYASDTIGHGLSSAPEMVIVKHRTSAKSWGVYSKDMGNDKIVYLNLTNAQETDNGHWDATTPTASVFSVGTSNNNNNSGGSYIAYCFHSVDGYSKVGSYTGNGSADGTFVYTGFRPAYVMIKCSTIGQSWSLLDSTRDDYNVVNSRLRADISNSESTSTDILDFTSNGFKCRHLDDLWNASGATYIYLAFAEHPFKYSTAR